MKKEGVKPCRASRKAAKPLRLFLTTDPPEADKRTQIYKETGLRVFIIQLLFP